jgi:tetratricopeptide (TPR) repeat protein
MPQSHGVSSWARLLAAFMPSGKAMPMSVPTGNSVAIAMVIRMAVGAQPSSSDSATARVKSKAEAERRFEQGLTLYQEGALDAALVEFERAYELFADFRILYNIAIIQAEQHDYVRAIQTYERYLEDAGTELNESRRDEVTRQLETLSGRIAQLSVESDVVGAELFVNEVSVGSLPLSGPVLINPGTCQIRLEKPGYRTARQVLKVAVGDHPRVALPLLKTDSSQVQDGKPAEDAKKSEGAADETVNRPVVSEKNWTPFWVSGGTAVVLGGVAATFGILTLVDNQKLQDEYDDPNVDEDRVSQLQNRGERNAILADAFTAGAVVAAAVSVYFLVSPPKKRRSESLGLQNITISPTPQGALLRGQF